MRTMYFQRRIFLCTTRAMQEKLTAPAFAGGSKHRWLWLERFLCRQRPLFSLRFSCSVFTQLAFLACVEPLSLACWS